MKQRKKTLRLSGRRSGMMKFANTVALLNFAGSNTALIHHKSRMENKYENSLGIEIDD